MEFSFALSFVPSWKFVTLVRLLLIVERTGEYAVHDDHIPLSGSGDLMKDKLLGISIADFAIAIVDEAETEKHVFQHWTVTGSLEDDNPTPSYLTI
jgi:putative NADH-flavin reductase